MKRRIYLLRHGKSSWSDPGQADRDRPLNARGRAAAERMGAWCADNAAAPELILCSGAARARETLGLLLPHLKSAARIEVEDGLYLAAAPELLARLRRVEDGVKSAMLIGHNPGLHELARLLAGGGEAKALARLEAKFPTAALAEFSFDLKAWRGLDAGRARLERLILPRELP
jgi:phosphohistidine phosphatase